LLKQPHGGYYRKHLDALNAGSRSREFSFILYLNNEWEPAHGGHLRVFLDYDSEETRSVLPDHSKRLDAFHASNLNYIDVPPLAGTMVLFKSDTVPHEVRPTSQKRIAIVGWFNRELSDDEVPKLDEEDLTPLAQAILEHYREKGEAVKF
jgi:SM-20-related protein